MRTLRILLVTSVAFLCLSCGVVPAQTPSSTAPEAGFWWYQFPSFAQIDDNATFAKSLARMNIAGPATDPTWGPYGQRLSELDHAKTFPELRATGARVTTWIEGFGDCMIYAGLRSGSPTALSRGGG